MKRLWRWLFNLAAGVSMVLCIGTCVLWVRSYFVRDTVNWHSPGTFKNVPADRRWDLSTGRGGSMLQWIDEPLNPRRRPPQQAWRWQTTEPVSVGGGSRLPGFWQRRGLSYRNDGPMSQDGTMGHHYLAVPIWLLTLTTAVLPALWLAQAVRRRKHRRLVAANRCTVCGYDLRATPDRCPECGTVPEVVKGAAT